VAEIAAAVNVTPAGVLEVMAQRARIDLDSLDETAGPGAGGALPHKELIRSLRAESFALPIEDRIALNAAVAKLSDSQRRLIELLFYREFTQREVAEALGVTTKKVSGELGKALTRLKELMGKRLF
jgi:RNA polymerase sigma-B factor